MAKKVRPVQHSFGDPHHCENDHQEYADHHDDDCRMQTETGIHLTIITMEIRMIVAWRSS